MTPARNVARGAVYDPLLLAVKIDAHCRNNGSPTQVRINARDNWWCPEGEPEECPEGEP